MIHMKSRELVTSELRLTRHQIATVEDPTVHRDKMRGAEDALMWLLAARVSPAPLTGLVSDSSDREAVRLEANTAEEVFSFGTRGATLSATAQSVNTWNYAFGVHESLAWAIGALDYTALGNDDDEVAEFASDLDAGAYL